MATRVSARLANGRFGPLVLKCDRCKLVQFPTARQVCRRCGAPYWPPVAAAPVRVGFAIRLLREARGIRQAELAQLAGIRTRQHISAFERATRAADAEQFVRLAAALDVSPRVLAQLATLEAPRA